MTRPAEPASNQAGEVEHGLGPHAIVIEGQGIDAFMPVAALSGNLVYLKQGAAQITMDQPMWRDLTAALATQPATSQEGEA